MFKVDAATHIVTSTSDICSPGTLRYYMGTASLNISKAEVLLTASVTEIVEGDMVLLTAMPISGIWSDEFMQSGDSSVSRLVTTTSTYNSYSVYVIDAIECPSDSSVPL